MSCSASVDLRDALIRATYEGALGLRFRPIVSLGVGVRRARAEIYWQHPEFGCVDRAEIRRIARSAGLTAAIDDWVLAEATSILRAWEAEPAMGRVRIAIPLSHAEVESSEDWERIAAISWRSASELAALDFEIGRWPAPVREDWAKDVRNGLRNTDFGFVLRCNPYTDEIPVHRERMPLRALQIDASGYEVAEEVDDLARRCKCVVEAAHRRNLEVIVSGVATRGMLRTVADTGVDAVQGPITGGPMDAGGLEDYVAFLRTGSIVGVSAPQTAGGRHKP